MACAGYLMFLVVRASLQRNRDAIRVLVGTLIFVTGAVLDVLGSQNALGLSNYGLTQYGFLILIVGIAAILASRFLRVHNRMEELNANLEEEVKQRTEELNESLTRIHSLKSKQDGDYFLMSLLIEPLGRNQAHTSNVKIETFTRQYKEFQFKGRAREIGGDLTIVDSVTLENDAYTAFITADAMGKSLQGASGALVLGALFRAIIARTRFYSRYWDYSPERWLQIALFELQDVFSSFDGNMLVSCVMGLVHQEQGVIYFINAEHPWTVLYRDEATFLESGLNLRKLGFPDIEKDLQIQVFQMKPGDVVIMGSDGRDDLRLGGEDGGVVDSDENRFLFFVDTARGDLNDIVSEMQRAGGISDDLSLLRIEYTPAVSPRPAAPASEIESARELYSRGEKQRAIGTLLELYERSEDTRAARELARVFAAEHDYESLADFCVRVAKAHPGDVEFLYVASMAYRRLQRPQRALDFAERVYLRERFHQRNLRNIMKLHESMGNSNRMRRIFDSVKALSRGDEYESVAAGDELPFESVRD